MRMPCPVFQKCQSIAHLILNYGWPIVSLCMCYLTESANQCSWPTVLRYITNVLRNKSFAFLILNVLMYMGLAHQKPNFLSARSLALPRGFHVSGNCYTWCREPNPSCRHHCTWNEMNLYRITLFEA